jgi:predicted nuclease of predicted toxin-antitoxin system
LTELPPKLRVLLDEGVPDSVGISCRNRGYTALLHREVLVGGVKDEVVCEAAIRNEAILIALDGDMKEFAQKYGATPRNDRFKRLNVIRLCCNEVLAAKRLEQAFTLIEHEWEFTQALTARRMWIELHKDYIRTYR